MNLFQLSWKNLTNKPLSLALNLILFALGTGLISLLLLLSSQLQEKFDKNLAGIDLVIGAKGSPLQLILCSMYHVDTPTGNISIKEAKPFMRPGHPLIKAAIPLSMGDNYKNYRIVGTTHDILALYNAEIQEGKKWEKTWETTIGATVAADLGLKIGDQFQSSHGFASEKDMDMAHEGDFIVVGILKPSGSVVDQLILTNTQTIWAVHEHAAEGSTDSTAHEAHADDSKPLIEYEDRDITSLLIQFKNRNYMTLNMGRSINENTDMQAAMPAFEINRLYANMGVGVDALQALAFAIILVSGLSIFISLFSSLKERRYELALMRVMGASRSRLFFLIILEGLLLAVLGCIIGLLLSHGGMAILSGLMKDAYRYAFSGWVFLKEEWILLSGALIIGVLAAVIPAIMAGRTDISETLAEG
ncbi:MAG: FtsX-like permease family protein [Saprospiraceae bacterium]|nr:FtsX-like permease family protein [Saprospiraceae bacterium]MDZ4705540.1 FtsX-like permease family protein [Saprospiraceae bacterium]